MDSSVLRHPFDSMYNDGLPVSPSSSDILDRSDDAHHMYTHPVYESSEQHNVFSPHPSLLEWVDMSLTQSPFGNPYLDSSKMGSTAPAMLSPQSSFSRVGSHVSEYDCAPHSQCHDNGPLDLSMFPLTPHLDSASGLSQSHSYHDDHHRHSYNPYHHNHQDHLLNESPINMMTQLPQSSRLSQDSFATSGSTSSLLGIKPTKTSTSGSHSKGRPSTSLFPCPVAGCSRRFTRKDNIKYHLRTHDTSRQRPFECDKCDKTYFRAIDLTRHVSVTHDKLKAYKCSWCGLKYTRKEALKRHCSKAHAKDIDDCCSDC